MGIRRFILIGTITIVALLPVSCGLNFWFPATTCKGEWLPARPISKERAVALAKVIAIEQVGYSGIDPRPTREEILSAHWSVAERAEDDNERLFPLMGNAYFMANYDVALQTKYRKADNRGGYFYLDKCGRYLPD